MVTRTLPSGVIKRAAADGPYAVLLLDASCTQDQVKKAYRRLSLEYHPDKCRDPGAAEAFVAISDAYTLLSDESLRRKYDDEQARRRRRDAEDCLRERREKERKDKGDEEQRGNPGSRPAFGRSRRHAGEDPSNNCEMGGAPVNGNSRRMHEQEEEKKAVNTSSSKGWAPKATTATGARVPSSFADFRARNASNAHAGAKAKGQDGDGVGTGGDEKRGGSEAGNGAGGESGAWGWAWCEGQGGGGGGVDAQGERMIKALRRFKQEFRDDMQMRREEAMVSELIKRGVKGDDVGIALLKSRGATWNAQLGACPPSSAECIGGKLNLRKMHDGDRMVMMGGGKPKDVFVWLSRQQPFVLQWRACDPHSKSAAPDGGIAVQAIRKVARLKDASGRAGAGDIQREGGSVFSVASAETDVKLRASGHAVREEWVEALLALNLA